MIDNDHLVTETRTDVVRGIKRKVLTFCTAAYIFIIFLLQLPDCLLNCVNFIPQHDSIQCLWSLNWLLARNVIAKENDGLSDDLPLSMYELKAQISSSSTSIGNVRNQLLTSGGIESIAQCSLWIWRNMIV